MPRRSFERRRDQLSHPQHQGDAGLAGRFEHGRTGDADPPPSELDDTSLEEVLAERLRKLRWPKAPPEVKQRGLDELLRRLEAGELDDEPDSR